MFNIKNRNFYLMRMENFTQNLSHIILRGSFYGFLLMAMLFSNDAISQCPLACNNNVQVSMDDDCKVEITPDMMLEGQGVSALCNYTVEVQNAFGQPIPTSPIVNSTHIGQTLTVKVKLGLNSCWGLIKVEDKLAPYIDCPADITLDCYDERTFALPTARDNCSSATVKELSNEVEDSACSGDTTAVRTIKYQATDVSGNKSKICTRKIYYIKIGIGDVVFPNDTIFNCDNNPNDNISPAWDKNKDGYPQPNESGVPLTLSGKPIYPNNSICELNATFTDQVLPICESSFKVLRQWVVLDWCTGTVRKDFQIVKIVDDQGPILTCPTDNQDVQANPYSCSGTWNVPHPIQIFDCSSTTYTVGYLLANANGAPPANGVYIDDEVVRINDNNGKFIRYEIRNLPVGRTWVKYTSTDACGNVGYCFTEVDVIDNVPPVAVCDQFTVVTLTNNANTQGVAYIFAKSFDDGSHDNCTAVTLDVRRINDNGNPTGTCESANSTFRNKVSFCCQDAGKQVMVEMRVTDANGLTNNCMVNVTVQDKTDMVITCPPAITINCTQDYKDLTITGNATATDNCGTPSITHTDNSEPNQCGVGTITRTFRAKLSGNTDKTCTQRITIIDNLPFSQLQINWNNVRDREINGCMDIDTDPSVTGRPTWTQQNCSLIAAAYTDQTFTLVDSACFKILRTWTIIDWCEYNQNNPSAGGITSRTQVIKLNNKVKPVFTSCFDKSADGYGQNCDGYIELKNDATDDCTPASKLKFTYRIDEDADGTFGPIRSGKDASGTFPVGKHKILWTVEDLCGNRTTCEYFFTIKDKKKPTPYCLSEITTVVMPSTKMIDIWASDFDKGSFDNCPGGSPDLTEITFSFSSTSIVTKKTYSCDNLGINTLQVWVKDGSGNQDYCTVRINIQSNDGSCEGSRIGGHIVTEDNKEVDAVSVSMENMTSHESIISATSANGEYQFSGMTNGTNYELSPNKSGDYMNGVSTLDLVMIQRHILGIDKFTSPYKIIAADVNNSQSVTASDLVSLRKLILGIYKELPNNESWRFVDGGYIIPEPNHPWPFNQIIDFMYNGAEVMTNDFKAVKVGDVNNTAKANVRDNVSGNRSASTLSLETKDINFSKDEVIRVPVTAAQAKEIFGFQLGLQFDTKVLEFVGIEARGIQMTEANIGLNNIENGIVSTSWNEANTVHLDKDQTLFDIVFKAVNAGSLKDQLNIASEGTVAEAYDASLQIMNVELVIRSADKTVGVELFQNTPNPFDNTTSVRFTLAKGGNAIFKIVDVTGRTVYKSAQEYKKGENVITLSANEINASGVLYYMLEVDGMTSTKKMILIRE